jgi:hypothetical protein
MKLIKDDMTQFVGQVSGQVRIHAEDQVWDQTSYQIWQRARDRFMEQLWDQVRHHSWEQLR